MLYHKIGVMNNNFQTRQYNFTVLLQPSLDGMQLARRFIAGLPLGLGLWDWDRLPALARQGMQITAFFVDKNGNVVQA